MTHDAQGRSLQFDENKQHFLTWLLHICCSILLLWLVRQVRDHWNLHSNYGSWCCRFLTGVVWLVGALIGAWPGGVCGHYNHTCLWALYVGFVNPCALSRTTTKYETENQDVKKDSINSDAIRLLRALLAPRSHYDNEDYGADEALQGG